MRQLEHHDLSQCLRRTPSQLLEMMKRNGKCIIVGGGFIRACITGERINDVDVFTPTPDMAKGFARAIVDRGKVFETDNAHSIRVGAFPVQFIHRWSFDDPAKLLESFDFTIACAAFWWKEAEGRKRETNGWLEGQWESLCDDRYYADLAAKRLIYRQPKRNEDAGGSLLRVLKFYQSGYRIPLDSFGACIARLVKGIHGLEQWDLVNDGLDETRFAKVATGLLREVDPNTDPDSVFHLPSIQGSSEVEAS